MNTNTIYHPHVGDVLIQHTCDAIELDLNGNTKRINEHDEHWLIEDIKKEGFCLYNLDNQRTMILSRGDMNWRLRDNILIPTDMKG